MSDNWYYNMKFSDCLYKKDAQEFENFFCEIMKAADDNFTRVKAYGNEGDDKCDGYNAVTEDYYQCYSPEDIQKISTEANAIIKIKADVTGMVAKWPSIKTINYVINDKYRGLSPSINHLIQTLNMDTSLPEVKLFSMEKLKDICLSLSTQKKQEILGFSPDISSSKLVVQFDSLSEIIKFIEENTSRNTYNENLVVPDFSDKIRFNNLSQKCADLLNYARYHISYIDEFFDKFPSYNKETLKNNLKEIYIEACTLIKDDTPQYADKRFHYILGKIVYNDKSKSVFDNALVIMATFFESCDIFEEPNGENDL